MTDPMGGPRVIDLCDREVVRLPLSASLGELARRMHEQAVPAVVVMEDDGPYAAPVGVVTRREIVRAVASDPSPARMRAADAVAPFTAFARGSDDLLSTLLRMEELQVAAVPVLDDRQGLVGLLTIDD